jgi:hypothetical protein
VMKEAFDTMLLAATGCTDAFWRLSAWYLNIQLDLPPKPGPAKMEKMEKIVVRMPGFISPFHVWMLSSGNEQSQVLQTHLQVQTLQNQKF